MSQLFLAMSITRESALFGTDGIRGEFGAAPLDEATIRAVARGLGESLLESSDSITRRTSSPVVVLGGDTRASTYQIATWIAAELRSAGVTVTTIGTAPTPAVAWTVLQTGASCGVAISASHNPHWDNGIKLFDSAGHKWSSQAERALEQHVSSDSGSQAPPSLQPLRAERELARAYIEHLEGMTGTKHPLRALRIAIDTANGAASPFARQLFEELGAAVTMTADTPNGKNINDGCGSTHPEEIAMLTTSTNSDLGVSFDGDADRVILADERGTIHDGDAILFLWARQLASQDLLPGSRVVATSMSNIGLERALSKLAIELVRCDVGDRAVVDTMRLEHIVLGGEQSGHIVHLPSSTTGDGLISALQMATLVATRGPLSELLDDFVRFPQLIKNVVVRHKPDLASIPSIVAHQHRIEDRLGDSGRLVLRYSGTENLARIMLEGEDQELIAQLAEDLAATLDRELA